MTETPGNRRRPSASAASTVQKNAGKAARTAKHRLPPNAGVGRKKGVPNRLTADEKAAIAKLVNYGLERAQGWLERVARKSPARALTIIAKFSEHIVPKLRGVEVSGAGGTPLVPPSFAFTMARGGPGTADSSVEVSGERGDGTGEEPPASLPAPAPAPIEAAAPELPRLQIEAPAQRQEPEAAASSTASVFARLAEREAPAVQVPVLRRDALAARRAEQEAQNNARAERERAAGRERARRLAAEAAARRDVIEAEFEVLRREEQP